MTLALLLILVPALILGVIYWLSDDNTRSLMLGLAAALLGVLCVFSILIGLHLLLPAIFHS